jgi:hypothetical protein
VGALEPCRRVPMVGPRSPGYSAVRGIVGAIGELEATVIQAIISPQIPHAASIPSVGI